MQHVVSSLRSICCVAAFHAGLQITSGQGFINLDFETTTVTTVHYPGGDRYFATLPGWSWSGINSEVPGNVDFNNITLDAPAVTLHGTNSGFLPAIQGNYSVLLQGGSIFAIYGTNGAAVFQTGQIPFDSQTLIYLGGSAVRVSFNGQTLPSLALTNTPNYTAWGVNISAYAGQSGELRFTAAWLSTKSLDGVQFSPVVIPEPNAIVLGAISVLCLFALRTWPPKE